MNVEATIKKMSTRELMSYMQALAETLPCNPGQDWRSNIDRADYPKNESEQNGAARLRISQAMRELERRGRL